MPCRVLLRFVRAEVQAISRWARELTRPGPLASSEARTDGEAGMKHHPRPRSTVTAPAGAGLISQKENNKGLFFVPFPFSTFSPFHHQDIIQFGWMGFSAGTRMTDPAGAIPRQPESRLQADVHPALDKSEQTLTCHFSRTHTIPGERWLANGLQHTMTGAAEPSR